MAQSKLIELALENNLCTLKCTTRKRDSKSPTYLLGLGDFEIKKDCTDGWIVVFSGNPMISHDDEVLGTTYFNKIYIGKLDLTLAQTKDLLQSSDLQDFYIYLYAGEFCLGKCQKSTNWDLTGNRNILNILCNRIDESNMEFDKKNVVQFKVKYFEDIIKPDKIKMGSGTFWKNRLSCCAKMGEAFEFRTTEQKVSVDFKHPLSHSGYELELIFSQHVVATTKEKHSVCRKTVLHHLKVYIRATILHHHLFHIKEIGTHSPEVTTIQEFRVPDYFSEGPDQVYGKHKVERIEFWVIARLIRSDGWRESTMGKVLIQEPVDTGDGNVTVHLSFPNEYVYSRTSPIHQYYIGGKCPSSSNAYPHIAGRLVFMDLYLDINEPGKNTTRGRANTW